MATLDEIFNSNPALQSLTTEQRVGLSNKLYDDLKAQKMLTGEQLRNFRKDQMGLIYADDARSGASPKEFKQEDWERSMLGTDQAGMPGVDSYYEQQGGKRVQSKNKELFDSLQRKHFREDLEAHKNVLTDWSTYPKAAVKLGADLFSFGAGATNALATGASNVMAKLTVPGAEWQPMGEAFSKGMEAASKTKSIEEINNWYENAIKDDPSLYKAYHAAATDLAIGMAFGGYRVAKSVARAAEAGNALSGMSKVRTFMAPVVSQPVGGQFIYHGLEGLDDKLKDTTLTDSQKNGIRIVALVAAALGSGVSIEPLIEKVVSGTPKIAGAAKVVGDAMASGKSFMQDIMENPYIPAATKKLLEDIPGVQNLDDSVIAEKMDDIISAQAKAKAGEELTAEEAQALQGAQPARAVEPLDDTEIFNFAPQPNAAPFDDLSMPYWKGGPNEERVRAAGKEAAPGEFDFFAGELDKYGAPAGVHRYRNEGPTRTLSAEEAAQLPTRQIMPLSKFTTTQRGLASIDQLTQRLRILRNSGGSPEQIADVQQQLANVHATLAIANDGLDSVRKQTVKELNKATAELKTIEQEGKKATPNESRQTLRSQWLQKKARVDQLQDRLTILNKQVEPIEIKKANLSAAEQRVLQAERDYSATYKAYSIVRKAVKKVIRKNKKLDNPPKTIRGELAAAQHYANKSILDRIRELRKARKQLQREQAPDDIVRKAELSASREYLADTATVYEQALIDSETFRHTKIMDATDEANIQTVAQNLKAAQSELEWAHAEYEAAKAEAKATALAKGPGRTTRFDIETKIAELPEVQQARVRRVAEAVIQGKEYLLARSLTEEERLDELTKVFNSQSWVDRTYAPSNTKELSGGYLSAGWVEDNYPNAAKLAAIIDPKSGRTQVISPDTVLRMQQDLFARAGFGMSQEGYMATRELMREVTELWDDMKGSIPRGEGQGLEEFLTNNAKVFGLTKKQATNVAKHIADALPDLGIAFKFDAGLRSNVKELADSLTRVITVGADQQGLEALMHGIGHLYFNYGLDSASKMAWLDNMRKAALDETSWAQNFPGYLERVGNLDQLDEAAAMKQLFWAHNPVEMFSQQFAAFTLNSVIPRMETLTTMGRLQAGLKNLLKVSYSDFEKLPEETRKFFIRTLAQPDVATIRRATPAEIDEALSTSWVGGKDRELDLLRVEELRQELDTTYNSVQVNPKMLEEVGDDSAEALEEGVLTDTGAGNAVRARQMANEEAIKQQNLWEMPLGERVMRYRPEDLNKALEMQVLSIYHGLPGGSIKEAETIANRLADLLSDKNIPDYVEYIVGKGRVKSKYGAESDPTSGLNYGSAGERRATEQQRKMNDANTEYNQLDTDAQRAVDRENTRRWWKKYGEAFSNFTKLLQQEGESWPNAGIKAAVSRALAGEPPANALEAKFQEMYGAGKQKMPPWNEEQAARRAAKLQIAAMEHEFSELERFLTLTRAKVGNLDLMDPSVQQRLSAAEAFASMPPNGQRPWWSAGSMYKATMRGLAFATGGVEYDPEGADLPFWGRVRWSPEKAFTSPMMAFLFPTKTVWKVASGRGSKLANLAYRSSVPAPTRQKIDLLAGRVKQMFKTTFTEGLGMPEELKDAISTSRVFGRMKQQEALEFSEIMMRHFSPKERRAIARILEQEPGWQGLTKWAFTNRPDVLNAVNILKKTTDQIEKDFKALGVESPRFADLRGTYLPRYYSNIKKRNLSRIFETSNLKQLKIDLLNQRGVPQLVKNESADGLPNKVFTELRDSIQQEGLSIVPGKTRVNSYKSPGGITKYAVEGSMLDKALAGQLEPYHVWGKHSKGFIVEDLTNSSYSLRRDYTKAERAMMGEIEDVSVRLAYMGEKLARSYERAHLFHSVAQSKYTIDPTRHGDVEVPGMDGLFPNSVAVQIAKDNNTQWVQVPMEVDKATGVPKYGAISGTYVHKDVFEALKMIDRMAAARAAGKGDSPLDWMIKLHKGALLGWKLAKTAYVPTAHMNNFVSNIWMSYLHGDNPVTTLKHGFSIVRLRNKDLKANSLVREGKIEEANQLRQEISQSPYYDSYMRIRKSGMGDSSMVASELRSEELAKILTEDLNNAQGVHTGPIQATAAILTAPFRKFHKVSTRLYEDGDLIFKFGSFHESLTKGMTDSEALRKAYGMYFDYSNLAPAAQALRDSGVMPFVSYTYKAIPTIVKAFTEHPERFAIASLALQGFNDLGVATLFGPEDVVKNREALDAAKPEYLRKLGLGGILNTRPVMPFGGEMLTNDIGQQELAAQYLDMSRMVPGGDLWETGAGLDDSEDVWTAPGRALASVLLESPVIAGLANLAAGKNIALGRKYNDGGELKDPAVQARIRDAWLDDMVNTFTPNLPILPWTYSHRNLVEGLVGEGILEPGSFGTGKTSGTDRMGIPQSFATAAWNTVGIKVKRTLPEVTFAINEGMRQPNELGKEKGRVQKLFRNQRVNDQYRQQELEALEGIYERGAARSDRASDMMNRLREARYKRQAIEATKEAHQRGQGGQTLPR